jgi:hypothetical protein
MPRKICQTCGSTFSCCNDAQALKSWRSIVCSIECYDIYLAKHFAWLDSQNKQEEPIVEEKIMEETIVEEEIISDKKKR